jgi:hypothetical protein
MDLFFVFVGIGLLTFFALSGVALIIIAARKPKADVRP